MAAGGDVSVVRVARRYAHGIQPVWPVSSAPAGQTADIIRLRYHSSRSGHAEALVFHVGIDIGGTFTDCVLIGDPAEAGIATYRTAKALSTKGDPADAVLTGLTDLAGSMGLALPELLARTRRFGHGTTIGMNAVLERTGPASGSSRPLGTATRWPSCAGTGG
jgi:hypothetical protein